MSRGVVWWGTAPLLVGGAGLLLRAFGAPGYEGSQEVNDRAEATAKEVEQNLKFANDPAQAFYYLQEVEGILKEAGKPADLQSMLDEAGDKPGPALAGKVHDLVRDALSDHRDPNGVIAERVAFYAGLVLVFAGGVLLYRRTPESVRGAW